MAGDWIKMRVDLCDDPAVIAMAATLGIDEDTVVGKLHRIWSWADKHTIDGTTNGVNEAWLDRFVACKGFGGAMQSVEWLNIEGVFLKFPHFDRHNGTSAKSRAEATIRQRLSRKNRDELVTPHKRVVTPTPFVRAVISRDGETCVYCGHVGSRNNKLGADHILPVSRGGKDAIENLVCCCSLCNNEKNDRTPEEWGMPLKYLPDYVTYLSQQVCDTRVTKSTPEKRREERTNTAKPVSLNGKHPIPDGWNPKPETLSFLSKEIGVDVLPYVSPFIDACKAKDYRYKDFEAAFRNCVRQDWPKFRGGKQASNPWDGVL